MNNNYNVPWSAVRDLIHLGYDYIDSQPSQFDFMSEISDEDLSDLLDYASLLRHYDEDYKESNSDWGTIIKLICVEQDYRDEH